MRSQQVVRAPGFCLQRRARVRRRSRARRDRRPGHAEKNQRENDDVSHATRAPGPRVHYSMRSPLFRPKASATSVPCADPHDAVATRCNNPDPAQVIWAVMRRKVGIPILLAAAALAVMAFAFFTKTTGAAPDPHGGCPAQLSQVDEALSQLSFSKSAASTVRSAVGLSAQRQQTYMYTSASLEQQLFRLHAAPQSRERIETELARANALLMDASEGLQQVQSLLKLDH